jgi:hypothetical protein
VPFKILATVTAETQDPSAVKRWNRVAAEAVQVVAAQYTLPGKAIDSLLSGFVFSQEPCVAVSTEHQLPLHEFASGIKFVAWRNRKLEPHEDERGVGGTATVEALLGLHRCVLGWASAAGGGVHSTAGVACAATVESANNARDGAARAEISPNSRRWRRLTRIAAAGSVVVAECEFSTDGIGVCFLTDEGSSWLSVRYLVPGASDERV